MNVNAPVFRASVGLLFSVWGSIRVMEVIQHPNCLGRAEFYFTSLIMLVIFAFLSIALFAILNVLYDKGARFLMTLIWFSAPLLIGLVAMYGVSSFHGFRIDDWIPLFVSQVVWSTVFYFSFLLKK